MFAAFWAVLCFSPDGIAALRTVFGGGFVDRLGIWGLLIGGLVLGIDRLVLGCGLNRLVCKGEYSTDQRDDVQEAKHR